MKHLLLTCFALFALSPCVVKDVLVGTLPIEYSKPLNKSKLTRANFCQYSQDKSQLTSVDRQGKINQQTLPDRIAGCNFVVHRTHDKIQRNYSKKFSGTSPPKYILYKRLKLDVV